MDGNPNTRYFANTGINIFPAHHSLKLDMGLEASVLTEKKAELFDNQISSDQRQTFPNSQCTFPTQSTLLDSSKRAGKDTDCRNS